MNRQETYKILSMLQANYPDSFRGMSKDAAEVKVNLWADMFADDPFELVAMAAKAYMAADTRGFMPTVGQLKDRLQQMRSGSDQMTGMEAWSIVSKALRNCAYGYEEEFAKLPPDIQRTVGSANQLREWALIDADTVQSVVSSNFQRSFKIRQQQSDDVQKLPGNVRKFVEELAGKMDISTLPQGSSGKLGEAEMDAIQQVLAQKQEGI